MNKKLIGAILTTLTFGSMSTIAHAGDPPAKSDKGKTGKEGGKKACGGPGGCGGAKKDGKKKGDGKACGGAKGCGGKK